MTAAGQWDGAQSMGRRWPIGCVALEITQRCNLDCSACYLSEYWEAVHDLPLSEIYRRIDIIRDHYGPDIGVQITGGDPTLRKPDELVAIVRRVRDRGLLPALFTNGIKATRSLLVRLVEAGLVDVAFHVDMTQGRGGYADEIELNDLRRNYIERARGLPLSVFFNTTVFAGNFHQIPDIVAFFVQHSDIVRLASFQPQAATGRGDSGHSASLIDTRSVITRIEQGAAAAISFDTAHIGHSKCNRYAMTFVANGHVHDVLDNQSLYDLIVERTSNVRFDRQNRRRAIITFLGCLIRNPRILAIGAGWFLKKFWQMKRDLLASRGRVHKLSFYIHNFMDACELDPERISACVFMVATKDGPISMCAHNAKRNDYILQPIEIDDADEQITWHPLTGGSLPATRSKLTAGRVRRNNV